jgi:hypothetical protein
VARGAYVTDFHCDRSNEVRDDKSALLPRPASANPHVQRKEPDFFIAEKNWHKGVKWYELHFSNNTSINGESSTSYTKYPRVGGVPQRMYSVVPQAKLIYVVRDPIDRIIFPLHT